MGPSSTNGNPSSARQALDAMRQVVENLEAELTRQQEEIKQLRKERDGYRKAWAEQVKHLFGDASDWDNFDPKDYTLTIDDLVAIIR
jgi:predicted  nucleic acid-binding Zn-ribbon protein